MPVPATPPRTPPPDEVAQWGARLVGAYLTRADVDEWLELHGYVLDAHDRATVIGAVAVVFGPTGERARQRSDDEVHGRVLEALALAARLPQPLRTHPPDRARRDAIAAGLRIRHGLPPLRG